jgi:hypothetical protein
MFVTRQGTVITGLSPANLFLKGSHATTKGRAAANVTSRGKGKQASESGAPGNELDDWLPAAREVDGRAPQRGESPDVEKHKP